MLGFGQLSKRESFLILVGSPQDASCTREGPRMSKRDLVWKTLGGLGLWVLPAGAAG